MKHETLERTIAYTKARRQKKRWAAVVTCMAAVVVFCTTYALILPAITLEGKIAYCGQTEHQHTDDCYTQALICGLEEGDDAHTHTEDCYETADTLICGLEEGDGHVHTEDCYETATVLACGLEENGGHVHTEDCYGEQELICGLEEHVHTLQCYSNPNADVETAADWEATLPADALSGVWAEDLVAVAESQLGYTESAANYTVLSDGETMKGYTRYGAWYGLPYGDWCAMFVSFCLNYANIPTTAIPREASAALWMEALQSEDYDLYVEAGDYIPSPGDLVFFDNNGDGAADHVGIVTEYSDPPVGSAKLKTIEGNSGNKVQARSYDWDDEDILGYAALPENPLTHDADYTYEDETIAVDVRLTAGTAVPEGAELSVRPITGVTADSESDHDYEALASQAEEAVGRTVTDLLLYDISFYTPDGAYLPVEDTAVVSLRFKEAVLSKRASQVAVLHFQEDAELPVALEAVDVERDENNALSAVTFQTEGFSTFAVMALADEGNTFTLTYNDYTITFYVVDAAGNAIPGDYSSSNITAEGATLYKFSELVPKIDGYTYSKATYGSATVVSAATTGFTNPDGTVQTSFSTAFQIYMDDPIVSGNWYSKDSDTVTLTYTKDLVLDGGSFVIVNQSSSTNYALTTDSTPVNGVDGLAAQTVTLNSSGQVTSSNVTEWKFTKADEDKYYISTTVDGEPKYLYLCEMPYNDNGNTTTGKGSLTLSDTPQPITVTVQSGNTVTLHAGNNSTVNLDDPAKSFWCYNDWTNPDATSQLLLSEVFRVNTVPGITPTGTVINLFDYWATYNGPQYDEDGNLTAGDYSYEVYNRDTGINADHFLKFTRNQTTGTNGWTGTVKPLQGIVQNTLKDGFPVLTAGLIDGDTSSTAESLAYLFDPDTNCNYRKTYRNVGGLLQVDSQGYYYFDSRENFAELNTDTNQFTLYDQGGVQPGGTDKTLTGQFFPFDSFAEVNGVSSASDYVNHYFGMTMTTRFIHRHDGYTGAGTKTPVVFEFAGDDDVWIFVDDVLVADLGGIHDRTSVKIDFSTGKIIINEGTAYETTTTLYDRFDAAGKTDTVEWSADLNNDGKSDTFANDTYHTLRFFYLERGNTDSNLHLKYNLASYPPTGLTKVNQYGDPVPGAEFSVYKANENYEITDQTPAYTGTTDATGRMVFVDEDNMPYTLAELQGKFGTYFVLKETSVPPGYRLVNDVIKLHITNNVLLCDNTWDSGVWADTNLQVSAPNTVKLANGTYNGEDTVQVVDANGVENGTIFAVVLKYTGQDVGNASNQNLQNEDNWAPVYGTSAGGYTVLDKADREGTGYEDSFIAAAIYAAQRYVESQNEFILAPSGALEGTLNGMPGAINAYYYMLPEEQKSQTEYTVAYYWTSANSLKNATEDNTYRVDADAANSSFDRVFGATINVPNLVNDLYAQKFNEDGERVNGAAFALYKVEEDADNPGTIYYLDADGNRVSLADADYIIDPATGVITGTNAGSSQFTVKPYMVENTMTANDKANKSKEDGTAIFANVAAGTYYLREIDAPDGYALNPTEVMVYVTANALYANAGTEDDGVTVARGPGYIVKPLDQFASMGEINNTLTWLYERMQITGVSNTFTAFNDGNGWAYLAENRSGTTVTDSKEPYTVHLVYSEDADNKLFNFTVNKDWYKNQNYTDDQIADLTRRLYTTVGWSYYELYQDYSTEHENQAATRGAAYEDLKDQEIANLFSRALFVQMTDEKDVGNLEVSKKVVPDATTTAFDFTLNLYQPDWMAGTDGDGTATTPLLTGTYSYQLYDVTYGEDGEEKSRTPVRQTSEDGNPVTDENGNPVYVTGTITDGTASFTLTNAQVIVIEDLPVGTHYTVTETIGEGTGTMGYRPRVSTNGAASVEGATTNGTLEWRGDREGENVCTVEYINALLPLIKVFKVDNHGKALAGASFVLYYKETGADGSEEFYYYHRGAFSPLTDGKTEADYARTTPNNGELIFASLTPGKTYYLKEVSAPDGYNKLTQEIEITVDENSQVSVTDGNNAEYQWDASKHDGQELDLTVTNSPGFELPETGGSGVLPYTIGGTLLMVGCLLCGYLLRRKQERRYQD